ncbi:MAG: galactose mutarotase [Ruminococcaceae bacterium]|nr:galactose mutarotase [Oscillospiraceae bacterium]
MSIKKKLFGILADGREVYSYTLRNKNGMKVKIMSYGGTILEIRTADRNGCFTDVIGGYDSLASYVGGDGYQGALIGRVGNRICDGRFSLDGKDYTLAVNNGKNHLHGGLEGFDSKIWEAREIDGDEPELMLSYTSPDGEEGYPGTLTVKVTYKLTEDNGLSINYKATTDKKTVINLTNHSYFNLSGCADGNVLDHELFLDADSYLPTDDTLIPTGELKSVEGTPFDFRKPKTIGRDIFCDDTALKYAGGYDHCLNFRGGETGKIEKRAELYDPKSGRVMSVYTDQPCVQFYTANFLNNEKYPMKCGFRQTPKSFVCLETQHMPDSINHPNFTSCVLDAREVYDYTTIYKFSVR